MANKILNYVPCVILIAFSVEELRFHENLSFVLNLAYSFAEFAFYLEMYFAALAAVRLNYGNKSFSCNHVLQMEILKPVLKIWLLKLRPPAGKINSVKLCAICGRLPRSLLSQHLISNSDATCRGFGNCGAFFEEILKTKLCPFLGEGEVDPQTLIPLCISCSTRK